jgi:hypothetical protein
MFKLSFKSHLLYAILVAVFMVGCKEIPKEYEYKKTVLKAKDKVLDDGTDRFVLGFTNGETEYCSYGQFHQYSVGDTLCWKRENGLAWYVVDCH